MAYGTSSTTDTLAWLRAQSALVVDIGEDRVFQAIDALREAHNNLVREAMTDFVEVTTDQLRRYGGPDTMVMDELSEFGTPDAQKISAGTTVGFPLRKYGLAWQGTLNYFKVATGQEVAEQFVAAQDADLQAIRREIRRAIFTPTNSTFVDRLVAGVSLPVKALVNADSAALPVGPNGETFNAATHTHYLATASLAAADLIALIETVIEHYANGQAIVFINRAQEAAVRALTGFVGYLDSRIIPATTANVGRGALDPNMIYNRAIGIFNGAEIWVKPWVPSSYMFAYLNGVPKPLCMRTRNERAGSGDLVLEFEDEEHPLRARVMAREFGFGVWSRTNGAVLYTGGGSYTAPSASALAA